MDASCLPTSAAVNPSLTVAAQALRAADQWLRETGAGTHTHHPASQLVHG